MFIVNQFPSSSSLWSNRTTRLWVLLTEALFCEETSWSLMEVLFHWYWIIFSSPCFVTKPSQTVDGFFFLYSRACSFSYNEAGCGGMVGDGVGDEEERKKESLVVYCPGSWLYHEKWVERNKESYVVMWGVRKGQATVSFRVVFPFVFFTSMFWLHLATPHFSMFGTLCATIPQSFVAWKLCCPSFILSDLRIARKHVVLCWHEFDI